jgi:hypothetical protein
MPAEKHISDLASFRYTPAKRASKTQQQTNDEKRVTDSDPVSLREATDFSKCAPAQNTPYYLL